MTEESNWQESDRSTAADRIPIGQAEERLELASRYDRRIDPPRKWPHVGSLQLRECPVCYCVVADVRAAFSHIERAHNQRERAHHLDEWAQDLAAELAELRGDTARYRRRLWGPEWFRNRPARRRGSWLREVGRAIWQGIDYGKQVGELRGEEPRKVDLGDVAERYGHLFREGRDDGEQAERLDERQAGAGTCAEGSPEGAIQAGETRQGTSPGIL